MSQVLGSIGRNSVVVLALIWLGINLGVGFIATPAKFLAPSLDLAVALDIGRHTFQVFNRVEWAFALVVLALVTIGRRRAGPMICSMALFVILAAESYWFLPALDARAGIIMQGQMPPPSALHDTYIAIEVGKVALLAILAMLAGRATASTSEGREEKAEPLEVPSR